MDRELTKKILNLNIAMGGLLFIVLFGYNRLEIGLMQAIALLIVFINSLARWAMRGQNKDGYYSLSGGRRDSSKGDG